LRTHPNADDRKFAAYALGDIGGKRAVAALRATVANRQEDAEVRGMAAEQLGASFAWVAVPDLIARLRDTTPEVRFWSAYALGFLRVREASRTLERLAKTDYARVPGWWTVKREARWALKEIARGPWEA
jgi:HEAT repeat protein